MVAYLTKSDASDGFNQIIDFLHESYLKYALTMNPNIYVSCIKQFWNTVAIKQVNDVTRLQALVDKKKVVVTEAAIREVLRLDDAEALDCLPNEEIFAELARMAMASANKRLRKKEMQMNILKMLLLVMMLKDLKASLPHLRVEHLKYDKIAQALEITNLKRRVKRLEKGDSARVLKLRRLQKVGTSQRVYTSDDTVMDDEINLGRMIDEMDKDDVVVVMDEKEEDKKVEEAKVDDSGQEDELAEVQEVVNVVTTANLILEVVTATGETVTAASAIISTVEPQVPAATITDAPTKVVVAPSRRRKGLVIRDPEEESTTSSIISTKTKSKDKGKGIMKKPQTESQAQKNMMMYLKNVVGFKLDYFKGMSYDDILLIFEAKFNSNIEFLLKTKEQIKEKENRALHSINETPAQKAAKRRKLNKEVEDLKRHMEIVPDEDDDVYTEATPLARKVPIVDYKIIELNNKPYYKIIRSDGTHQLYISFLTLLKNFDREDLEALWSLVKERFSTSKPKNFSDDFLLTTLRAMFEKPDVQAQLILLIERRYPLLRFTLDQMLNNVRLQVEEESECCQAKLMLLDNVVEARLMLLSHINAVKVKMMLSRQS
nr:hypothetical protein [Tanacetum cinerariifolium]